MRGTCAACGLDVASMLVVSVTEGRGVGGVSFETPAARMPRMQQNKSRFRGGGGQRKPRPAVFATHHLTLNVGASCFSSIRMSRATLGVR